MTNYLGLPRTKRVASWDMELSVLKLGKSQANWEELITLEGKICDFNKQRQLIRVKSKVRCSKALVKTLSGYRGERALLAGVSWRGFDGEGELKLSFGEWLGWIRKREALKVEGAEGEICTGESHTCRGFG